MVGTIHRFTPDMTLALKVRRMVSKQQNERLHPGTYPTEERDRLEREVLKACADLLGHTQADAFMQGRGL